MVLPAGHTDALLFQWHIHSDKAWQLAAAGKGELISVVGIILLTHCEAGYKLNLIN